MCRRHSKFHFTSIHPWYVDVVVLLFCLRDSRCIHFCSHPQLVERDNWWFEARCILLESNAFRHCVSALWCTIFTAIYGFEGFVNIILMFNETIINQIVCESKIATMTFFFSPLLKRFWCFFIFDDERFTKISKLQRAMQFLSLSSNACCCYCNLKEHKMGKLLCFCLFTFMSFHKTRKRKGDEEVKRTKTIINYFNCITSCVVSVTHFPQISNDLQNNHFKSHPDKQKLGENLLFFNFYYVINIQ